MTYDAWFTFWDNDHHKFEWIFKEHTLNSEWQTLLSARDKEHRATMLTVLNKVWLVLPSSKFNIRANPKGWSEFLYLCENE